MTRPVTIDQIDSAAAATDQGWRPPQLAVIVPSFNERDNVGLLYDRLTTALAGIPFEFIVVDDNSPDGTAGVVKDMARRFPNVRCIHRIGRRGLSSAVVEGVASSAAPYLAVIDADLQHDESILSQMFARAAAGDDIVVGTRYAGDGTAGGGGAPPPAAAPPGGGGPRGGRRAAPPPPPRPPGGGGPRRRPAGRARESKMNPLVVIQFLGLLLSKFTRGVLPTSFLLFSMVGGSGIFVHMASLWLAGDVFGFNFTNSQLFATLVAMTTNFVLNNELTYSDKKLRGTRFWTGLLSFYAVCSLGMLANISVAVQLFNETGGFLLAGFVGALMSVVFNYSVTRVFTWR